MFNQKFFELARQYFAYLEEYGFRVVQEISYQDFDNAEVQWQSQDCRIRVTLDKGQILLAAAPLEPPDEWYRMGHIVEYLTHGTDKWVYELPLEWKDYDDWLRWQFDRLARMLRPYCDKIGPLFRPDVFSEARWGLDMVVAERGEMAQRLSRDELVRLVEKIRRFEGTEEELSAMLLLLERSVPHPEVTDLIYWSKEELTAEEIVDRALSYKPIILPAKLEPPPEAQ